MKRTPLKRGTKMMKRTGFRVSPKNALKGHPRPSKPPMARKPTIAKLKKKLDTIYSRYIRAKFPKKCYTCGYVGNLQCGHFVSRQYLATRWEDDNCRPQCAMCNIWGRGMLLDFEENLKNELGDVRVEELKKSRHQIIKLDIPWYEHEIAKYQGLLDSLTDV
jgi:hypothetical protein